MVHVRCDWIKTEKLKVLKIESSEEGSYLPDTGVWVMLRKNNKIRTKKYQTMKYFTKDLEQWALLKGSVCKIFTSQFFWLKDPSRSPDWHVKAFLIGFEFTEIFGKSAGYCNRFYLRGENWSLTHSRMISVVISTKSKLFSKILQ